MLLCRHDLSLGRPHQKQSSKRRERWQEGSLTQHKGRGSCRREYNVHVTATEHFPGSQCWGTLQSWFCSLITCDAPNALGREVNVQHHQPPRRWEKGDVGSKPQDEWKGISSSTSEQAAWHKLTRYAKGRRQKLTHCTQNPFLVLESVEAHHPLSYMWTYFYSQAADCIWKETHSHISWARFKLMIANLRCISSWGLAVPLFGLFPLAIPYMTILCTFPQTSCITPASLFSSAPPASVSVDSALSPIIITHAAI